MIWKGNKEQQYKIAVEKELKAVEKLEKKMQAQALKESRSDWKAGLERKVPEKVLHNLEKAFCKGFEVVFQKGSAVIEKSYDRKELEQDFAIHEYAFQLKGNRKVLRAKNKEVTKVNTRNMALTTVEGIGLGALGIGLPDIVLFVGMLLKGVYEVSLNFGFDYDTPEERYLILKMMEVSMLKGDAWVRENEKLDEMMFQTGEKSFVLSEDEMQRQIEQTARRFAMDMLVLKFIQGMPIVGIIGGASNPIYYNKVMKFVQVKYRKRYLVKLLKEKKDDC